MGSLMWMTRRSPSQAGGNRNPEDSHLNPLALLNQKRMWDILSVPLPLGCDWVFLRINAFSGEALLGKTKVSFKQWYYEVQCAKDHYLESVVQENIGRSLKFPVVDMAQYMGPTTSVAHIRTSNDATDNGTVVSFDVLMWNFYNVTQGNHEKIPSFIMRLEGTLNQIRLQCPGRVTDLGI